MDKPRSDSEGGLEYEFAPLYVEEVEVRNFRGIDEAKVEFEPDLTVLVGRNNAGKSRLLRAMAIALGEIPADRDDWTVDGSEVPTIDVILAPPPTEAGRETFDRRVAQRLESVQPLSDEPERERFAWRTTIRASSEGFGVRADHTVLLFDQSAQEWRPQPNEPQLSRDQRSVVACDLVDSRRDLVEDLARRGSAMRRILDDLEVPEARREELQAALAALGVEIVADSASLASVKENLDALSRFVETIGTATINPIPPRLEDLSRSISIDFDTGTGSMPLRYHGAGARSLAALQAQGVMYARRLGRDGPTLLPHPVSLIEEPEAHLHPQAQFDLASLLNALTGQVIVSTHSSHLVSVVDPRAIRVLQGQSTTVTVRDLRVSKSPEGDAKQLESGDLERLRRMIERPFGELLFASAIVVGDGATERGLLPPLIRHRLGVRSHGVCVVDPESMSSSFAIAIVKFANRMGLPWFLFADTDADGKKAAESLVEQFGEKPDDRIIWVSSEDGVSTEGMLLDFDADLCETACTALGFSPGDDLMQFLKRNKGTYGRFIAAAFLEKRPWPEGESVVEGHWPGAFIELMTKLSRVLGGSSDGD